MKLRNATTERRVKSEQDWSVEKRLRIFNSRRLDEIIWLSAHSVERYRERFLPTYALARAKEDLKRRMRVAEFVIEWPIWLGRTSNQTAIGYVVCDEEVALPIVDNHTSTKRFVATTCLYRLT